MGRDSCERISAPLTGRLPPARPGVPSLPSLPGLHDDPRHGGTRPTARAAIAPTNGDR